MRSITFNAVGDQTSPVAAGFVVGYSGFVYEDGASVDASAVTVEQIVTDPAAVKIGNLPEVDGREYAVVFTFDGFRAVRYYPGFETGFLKFRAFPLLVDGQTLASLGLQLLEDGVDIPVSGLLSVDQPAGEDPIVKGFPAAASGDGFFTLMAEFGIVDNKSVYATQWTIAAGPTAGSRPAYSLPSDLDVFGTDRLLDVHQDESVALAQEAAARFQADASIDSAVGACYDVPLKEDLTGTWTVSIASQAVTGTGGKADEELFVLQMVTLAGEDHEVAAVLGPDSFTLRDPHLGGGTDVTAVATPRLSDSMVRHWSAILTLERIGLGATAHAGSLKLAIEDVKAEMKRVCDGAMDLPGLVRTDFKAGFGFEVIPLGQIPSSYNDLRTEFARGRRSLELT